MKKTPLSLSQLWEYLSVITAPAAGRVSVQAYGSLTNHIYIVTSWKLFWKENRGYEILLNIKRMTLSQRNKDELHRLPCMQLSTRSLTSQRCFSLILCITAFSTHNFMFCSIYCAQSSSFWGSGSWFTCWNPVTESTQEARAVLCVLNTYAKCIS